MPHKMTKAEFRVAVNQWKQATSKEMVITCPCGKNEPIQFLYKCLYCNTWFCKTCAEKHFGMTRREWRHTTKEIETLEKVCG